MLYAEAWGGFGERSGIKTIFSNRTGQASLGSCDSDAGHGALVLACATKKGLASSGGPTLKMFPGMETKNKSYDLFLSRPSQKKASKP